ncbi:MAG: hypothetical protein PHZ06_12265 [Proteiniphilum sp.]|nr:hypothetical protein [Proteiniphilum sp.]
MGYYGFVEPDNKIIAYAPNTVLIQEEKAEATTIKPGMVVMKGTNDDDVVICDGVTKAPFGVAGYEQSFLGAASSTSNRPANVDTAYAKDARVPVLGGGGFVAMMHLAPGVGTVKGDLLASWGDGTVVPVVPMPGGYGVRIPFAKKDGEFDTGVDLPEGMINSDVIVEVTKEVADATIDVGLLSTEDNNGGDADGFLDGESCAALGFVKHNTVALTSAADTLTLGDYFKEADIKDATATEGAQTYRVPNYHVVGDGQVSVSYTTTNSANLAGNFYMVCAAPGFQIVGRAEETLAVATATVDNATVFVSQDVMARVYI